MLNVCHTTLLKWRWPTNNQQQTSSHKQGKNHGSLKNGFVSCARNLIARTEVSYWQSWMRGSICKRWLFLHTSVSKWHCKLHLPSGKILYAFAKGLSERILEWPGWGGVWVRGLFFFAVADPTGIIYVRMGLPFGVEHLYNLSWVPLTTSCVEVFWFTVSLSARVSACLSVCLSVRLSIFDRHRKQLWCIDGWDVTLKSHEWVSICFFDSLIALLGIDI